MPVPMAVPPIGSRRRRFSASSSRASTSPSCVAQAPSSWSKRSGIASIRCVRPVLAIFASSRPRRSMVLRRCFNAGRRRSPVSSTAATWMQDGITSFDDCAMFTSSFACTGRPSACAASRAITSLAFMLLDVPEPVWKTSTGKAGSNSPAATRSAAARIALARALGMAPRFALASAQAALTRPSARRKARGMRQPETGKLSTARWVWMPQRASTGRASSPRLSFSMRVWLMFGSDGCPIFARQARVCELSEP